MIHIPKDILITINGVLSQVLCYVPEGNAFLIQNFATEKMDQYHGKLDANKLCFNGKGKKDPRHLTAIRHMICLGIKELDNVPCIFNPIYKEPETELEGLFQTVFSDLVMFEDGLISFEKDEEEFADENEDINHIKTITSKLYREDIDNQYIKVLNDFFNIYNKNGYRIIECINGKIKIERL